MNHYRLSNKSKTHIQIRKHDLFNDSENSAIVHWYKWFICYLNKSHIFATFIDKQGVTKAKCIRCGVERIKSDKADGE